LARARKVRKYTFNSSKVLLELVVPHENIGAIPKPPFNSSKVLLEQEVLRLRKPIGRRLSILLKSYWNIDKVEYGLDAVLTFNSSKVLLERSKRLKSWQSLQRSTFNSSKVLLELVWMSRHELNERNTFNSSKVLLELHQCLYSPADTGWTTFQFF